MYKNDCVNHLDLYHITGSEMTYSSANDLTSNGSVESGQSITFKGGQNVLLQSGFHAKAGSSFIAKIESCENASAQCDLALSPNIELSGTEDYEANGQQWTRYNIPVTNWQTIPTELFVAAPNLPACGLNTDAARTWVNIYDASNDAYIYGFCALGTNSSLQNIWFAQPRGECPPSSIYIKLIDRACDKEYTSNTLNISCDASLVDNGRQNRLANQPNTPIVNYELIKEEKVWADEGAITMNNNNRESIVALPSFNQTAPTLTIMPNPTSQLTKIILNQSNRQAVSLQIRNIAGQLMQEVLTDEILEKGIYHYEFDASLLSEGVYFVNIQSGHRRQTEKLVVVR